MSSLLFPTNIADLAAYPDINPQYIQANQASPRAGPLMLLAASQYPWYFFSHGAVQEGGELPVGLRLYAPG